MAPKVAAADARAESREGWPRVLVVDDVPEIARVMRLVAETVVAPRLDVTTAQGGEEALGLIERGQYDLVLSDLRMPKVDGLEVLRVARLANPRGYRWLMTAFGEVAVSPDRVRAAGLDALIQKPIAAAVFIRMLAGTFRGNAALVAQLREAAASPNESG